MTSLSIENAELREEVRAAIEHQKQLSSQLLELRESERRHLARELHDEIGQTLTGLRMLLRQGPNLTIDSARLKLDEAKGYLDGLLSRIRGIAFDLRPAVLDQFGLLRALLALFERYQSQTGIHVTFEQVGIDRRFDSAVELAAYRIVQEGLTNVARHAGVNAVTARIQIAADLLRIQIEDHGKGFNPESDPAGTDSIGLAGMWERIELLGGRLSINSRPESGTLLTSELPLNRPSAKGINEHHHCFGG